MDMNDFDWHAHLFEGPREWSLDATRLVIWRRRGGGEGEQIIGFDDRGIPITETVEAGALSMFQGFRIPTVALDDLRDQLKPGPSEREHAQLAEALVYERHRLDRVLGAMTRSLVEPPRATVETFLPAEPADDLDREAVREVVAHLRALDDLGSPYVLDELTGMADKLERAAGPA